MAKPVSLTSLTLDDVTELQRKAKDRRDYQCERDCVSAVSWVIGKRADCRDAARRVIMRINAERAARKALES